MSGVEIGDFGSPDETRTPDKTTVELVRMGGATASRMRLEPGWSWSECVKPIAGGERCQAHHVGLLQSGTMRVVHEDGTEQEIRAGQAYVIEPGHDAWVVGEESPGLLGVPGKTHRIETAGCSLDEQFVLADCTQGSKGERLEKSARSREWRGVALDRRSLVQRGKC